MRATFSLFHEKSLGIAILAAEKGGRTRRADIFQTEWLGVCKGKYDNVAHGASSKTHCDFGYSATMIEQMLLGLVAHPWARSLSTTRRPAVWRIRPTPTSYSSGNTAAANLPEIQARMTA